MLKYKPHWQKAKERWNAFWERAATDRPCLDVRAPRSTNTQPPPVPQDPERLYLDPDYVAASWVHQMQSTYLGGEAVPVGGFLMGGYALGCGDGVVFDRATVWHPVKMRSIEEPVPWHPGPDDPWRAKLERVVLRLLDVGRGRFLVGYPGQVPVNDLLELLRGVDAFLLDLAIDCERCVRQLEETFPRWLENAFHFRCLIDAHQHEGCVYGWPGIWRQEFFMTTQSDMSCMISAEHFRAYVLHEMDLLAEHTDCIWYHMDGSAAKRHLAALCSRPYIRCIQYVPSCDEPPNGPYHLEFYRQVQRAGRCLDIAAPFEHLEFLVRHLRPEGLIIRTWVHSVERADELLDDAARWCGTHVNTTAG